MATESSAVARFIELQQKERIYGSGDPLPTDPTDPFLPVARRRTPLIIVFAVLAAGAAVTAGVFAAKSGFWRGGQSASAESAGAAPTAATPAAALLGESEKEPEPEPTPAAVVGDLEPAADAAEKEELDQAAAAAEPDPDTGFDLRVEPEGVDVLLDGKKVGAAPLRVRNVAPGRHMVEVVAPEGYFSKHLVVVLEKGEPQELEVELAPVAAEEPIVAPLEEDEELAAAAEEAQEEEREAREPVRLSRKERRARRRAERRERRRAAREHRRETRAAAADKAPAAPAVSGPAGTLRLGAKPPMAIVIDGRPTGLKTPQRSIKLSAGTHRVKLVNREFGIREAFKVRIAPNKTTTVIRDLSDKL